MENEKLMDINEVCRALGCTSRTLRFYEEKGIIKSTKSPNNRRRQYNDMQIKEIKDVLVLRSLGLPVAKIKMLKSSSRPLADLIAERKAELIATIASKSKEYNLLCEALATIEDGGSIFENKEKNTIVADKRRLDIVKHITECFLNEYYDLIYDKFSDMLKEYISLAAFKRVICDTLEPIGKFIEVEKITRDEDLNNVYYSYLKHEKLGLYIKTVFHKEQINGFWLNYYHYKGEK